MLSEKEKLESPFCTQDEFWRAMGGRLGRNYVRRFVKEGKIKSVAVGVKRLIPKSEIEDFPRRVAEEQK